MSDQSPASNVEPILPFWKTKSLHEMSKREWESICDGCAKCCLIKLQDEESDDVAYTNIVCRYLDADTCQCTEYQQRNKLVPHCVWLKPEMIDEFFWLPDTCAYRLVAENKELPKWHPLLSGDDKSIHHQGQSVYGKVYSEEHIPEEEIEEYIIHWVN